MSIILNGCVSMGGVARFSESEVESVNIFQSENVRTSTSGMVHLDLTQGVGSNRIEQKDLVDTLFFLPLETNQESVFGSIEKILFSDDRIIIKDGDGNFLIFDITGRFISCSKKGNGPGEVGKLWDIAFDEEQQQIIAYQSDFLNFYDKNGNFICNKKCPIMSKELFLTSWGYLFFQDTYINYHLGIDADNLLLLSDKNFSVFGKGGSTCKQNGVVSSLTNVFKIGKDFIVSNKLNDTIFQVSGKNIYAKYVINYGSSNIINSDKDKIMQSGLFYFNGRFFENSQTQLFQFWSYKSGLCFTFRDKKNGNVMGGTIIRNNERELPLCIPNTCGVYNDYFVSFNTPYKGMYYNSAAVSEAENAKLAQLSEEDNCILIFYKVKELR